MSLQHSSNPTTDLNINMGGFSKALDYVQRQHCFGFFLSLVPTIFYNICAWHVWYRQHGQTVVMTNKIVLKELFNVLGNTLI